MPRDPGLIASRNAKIYAAYTRLISQDVSVTFAGRRVPVRLQYVQVIKVIGATFDLSPRTVEPIITATAAK